MSNLNTSNAPEETLEGGTNDAGNPVGTNGEPSKLVSNTAKAASAAVPPFNGEIGDNPDNLPKLNELRTEAQKLVNDYNTLVPNLFELAYAAAENRVKNGKDKTEFGNSQSLLTRIGNLFIIQNRPGLVAKIKEGDVEYSTLTQEGVGAADKMLKIFGNLVGLREDYAKIVDKNAGPLFFGVDNRIPHSGETGGAFFIRIENTCYVYIMGNKDHELIGAEMKLAMQRPEL